MQNQVPQIEIAEIWRPAKGLKVYCISCQSLVEGLAFVNDVAENDQDPYIDIEQVQEVDAHLNKVNKCNKSKHGQQIQRKIEDSIPEIKDFKKENNIQKVNRRQRGQGDHICQCGKRYFRNSDLTRHKLKTKNCSMVKVKKFERTKAENSF